MFKLFKRPIEEKPIKKHYTKNLETNEQYISALKKLSHFKENDNFESILKLEIDVLKMKDIFVDSKRLLKDIEKLENNEIKMIHNDSDMSLEELRDAVKESRNELYSFTSKQKIKKKC